MEAQGFKFGLGERVALVESDESGEVIAYAQYLYNERQYLVRYCAGDGRQVEAWWAESALK